MVARARMFFCGLALLSALFLAGCTGEKAAPWRVEVSGCETWIAGPACTIGTANLRIWIAGGEKEKYEIELDEDELVLRGEPAGGGQQFKLPVPATARKLRIRRPGGGAPFELDLSPSIQPAYFKELAGKSDKEAHELLASKSDLEPAWKFNFQARVALGRGERREAAQLARKGAELWMAAGRSGSAVKELALASYLLAEDGHYPESREVLEQAEAILESTATWGVLPVRMAYLVGHQRAVLAYYTGDVRNALASLDQLAVLGEHSVLDAEEISDHQQLAANVLAGLGRFDEAAKLLDGLRELSLADYLTASLDANRGWVAYLARQAGQADQDPRPFFEAAWEYYREHGLGRQKFNSQLNLALVAVSDRRLGDAQEHLVKARAFESEATALEGFQFKELEARMLLLGGKPQAALDRFRQLDLEASGRHLPEAQWQALIGIAEAQAALGQPAAAVDAFERAEKLESHELMFIPLDRGRETFLARRERITRQHLELLFEQQREEQALDLVRRRRVQALALLRRDERVAALPAQGRRNWEKAAAEYRRLRQLEENGDSDEDATPRESRAESRRLERDDQLDSWLDAALAELGFSGEGAVLPAALPGELTLAFFPRESSWLIFALDQSGVAIEEKRVAAGTPLEAVAAELLTKVAPRIDACRRIRVLSWGGLDFHALPFEGKPLVAAKPIVYGVDAGAAERAGPAAGAGRRVVLVADPTKLRWAQKEIEAAERTLAGRAGFALDTKLLGREAKAEPVRRALERADYFHFAGHGEFDRAGSQSRLLLSGGELKAGDVFTLEKVPKQVVLSSCHVGQSARASGVEGLGLAYAFVLAGSRQVLAATREVNDGDTAQLIRALYEHIEKTPGEIDLAASLREAQLELSRKTDQEAWKAFRVFEP